MFGVVVLYNQDLIFLLFFLFHIIFHNYFGFGLIHDILLINFQMILQLFGNLNIKICTLTILLIPQ